MQQVASQLNRVTLSTAKTMKLKTVRKLQTITS